MPDAEEVAAAIAYELFREGRFAQSTGPIEVPGLIQAAGVTPAYAKREVPGVWGDFGSGGRLRSRDG